MLLRPEYLSQKLDQPLPTKCLREGRVVAACVADHIKPHHNDPTKFWFGKLQSLCTHCHESRKQFEESRGFDLTVGIDGWPIDPRHLFYQYDKR
jgi:hypothetical protein